eukprot:80305-Pleurochrysis_carterae.AAC.2
MVPTCSERKEMAGLSKREGNTDEANADGRTQYNPTCLQAVWTHPLARLSRQHGAAEDHEVQGETITG